MKTITTRRLELAPITLPMVEAVFAGDRRRAEALVGASLPEAWPGRSLIERAFTADLEAIRHNPELRLWGDRLMISRDGPRRVVGSVIFHGFPDDGVAEVGYGVEADSQGLGYATEATCAAVDWALTQPGIRAVSAVTFPWHHASLRVIAKAGMVRTGARDHDLFGEVWIFERRAARASASCPAPLLCAPPLPALPALPAGPPCTPQLAGAGSSVRASPRGASPSHGRTAQGAAVLAKTLFIRPIEGFFLS